MLMMSIMAGVTIMLESMSTLYILRSDMMLAMAMKLEVDKERLRGQQKMILI